MANKKQPEEERKPDLATPDQEEVEARVKAMLDLSEEEPKEKKPEATKIHIQEHTEEPKQSEPEPSIASAPELPSELEEPNKEKEKTAEPKDDEKSEVVELEVNQDTTEGTEKVINLDEAPTEKAIEPIEIGDELHEGDNSEETEAKTESEEEEIPDSSEIDSILDDKSTAKAVDDIVAHESDELLAVEDEKFGKSPQAEKKSKRKLSAFLRAWWTNPKARWGTIIAVLAIFVAILAVPMTRYKALNAFGIRASITATILDESTGQPLKNVQVNVNGVSEKTDSNGIANLAKVKLGKSQVTITKRAFADYKQTTTITFGSNALGKVKLKPVGAQYSFVITDFLSGKPIEKVEASRADATALSNEEGKIKLTIDEADDNDSFEVAIKADGYREEHITITSDAKNEKGVVLVPSRKHTFVSKRSGKYDLYTIDVDGKNEKLIMAGTGSEREDVALSVHTTADIAAMVSTRGSQKNSDGYLLGTLTFVDLQTGDTKTVTTAERVQMIDWVGDRLIYVQAIAGTSAANPKRHRLMSYDHKTSENKEIAASNYFNDVLVANKKIYYAPSSAFQTGSTELYSVDSDGNNKVTILAKETWNLFRVDHDNLVLSAQQDWYNLRLGDKKPTSLSSRPSNLASRIYADSPDGKHSLWVDSRDGKGVLLAYEPETKNELALKSQSGLRLPVRWLSNKAIVYRVSNEQETADYAISLDGGEPKKIRDVTNTNSIDKWYYY